ADATRRPPTAPAPPPHTFRLLTPSPAPWTWSRGESMPPPLLSSPSNPLRGPARRKEPMMCFYSPRWPKQARDVGRHHRIRNSLTFTPRPQGLSASSTPLDNDGHERVVRRWSWDRSSEKLGMLHSLRDMLPPAPAVSKRDKRSSCKSRAVGSPIAARLRAIRSPALPTRLCVWPPRPATGVSAPGPNSNHIQSQQASSLFRCDNPSSLGK